MAATATTPAALPLVPTDEKRMLRESVAGVASTRLLRVAPVSRGILLNNIAEHTLGLPRSVR